MIPPDPSTVRLRDIETSDLVANYLLTRREVAAAIEFPARSALQIMQEKLERELYRRAIEHNDLSVQVDGRTYIVAPKARDQIELIEIA